MKTNCGEICNNQILNIADRDKTIKLFTWKKRSSAVTRFTVLVAQLLALIRHVDFFIDNYYGQLLRQVVFFLNGYLYQRYPDLVSFGSNQFKALFQQNALKKVCIGYRNSLVLQLHVKSIRLHKQEKKFSYLQASLFRWLVLFGLIACFFFFFYYTFFYNNPSLYLNMSATEASADKYTQVRQDIAKAFPKEEYDDGSFAPVV